MSRNHYLEWALFYIRECAVPVFPIYGTIRSACTCGDLACRNPGKHPHTAHGLKDASSDEKQIREWWQKWPDANIGMPTGNASLLWVLDVDLPDGESSLSKLVNTHQPLPDTAVSITGSGGRQFFYAYPGQPLYNTTSRIAPNLDTRGEGGYVILPPSRHIVGRKYSWIKDHSLKQLGFLEAPDWLLQCAIEASKKAETTTNGSASHGAVPEGARNDHIYRLARSLRARRLKEPVVLQAVLAENQNSCVPPLTDEEVRTVVANAFNQPHRVDFAEQAEKEEKEILAISDPMAIARKWSALTVERPEGRWLHHWDQLFWQWSGAHYRSIIDGDVRAELWRFMRDRSILLNADAKPAQPNHRSVADVLSALQAHVNIPRHALEPPCWIGPSPLPKSAIVVPVANGLLDLKTQELHPSNPRYFNLHHAAAEYDPRATAPTWLTFLDGIWGSEPEQVETLQEIFGYLLAERMDQQKMFMLIGPPRSGKGTIANVIEALLGDDAVARPTSTNFGAAFGVESLIGRSLAIISDARFDVKANDAVVEVLLSVSGQDSIDVTRKYRTDWRGKLRTRFMVLSNELPRLWDSSGAISSRFIVLVTRISFLGKEDFTLTDRLKQELPGVLNWAIAGWKRLVKRGHFIQPTEAEELVDQFKTLSAPLTEYVTERCFLEPNAICDLNDLYKDYLDWCEHERNKYPLAKNMFARDLRANQPGLIYKRKTLADGRKISRIGGLRLRFEPSGGANASYDEQERAF